MKQIELLLQNKGRNINVKFPCAESEYQATCEELELKDNYAFVKDVVEPKALSLKKDTFVNLDEINYLAKRIDSFDQKELFSFFAAIETGEQILKNGTELNECYRFENRGLTNLYFPFGNAELDMGKLAIWRIKARPIFGCMWLSDYVDNHLGGFAIQSVEQTQA